MSEGTSDRPDRRGLWLGLLGVAVFSVTLPMTRLAVGTPEAPLLSGSFVAMARAVLAAGLSALYLAWVRAAWPARRDWGPLTVVSLGVVFGFPVFTSLAMRHVQAMHASVMLGVLPLATAAVGAVLHRQRPPLAFWACAVLGSALVVGFALLRSPGASLALHPADALLCLGMGCAALGYAWGARLASRLPAEQVICWALLLSLPLTLPGAWLSWPAQAVGVKPWAALGYLAVFSMWLGFFAWYRGLALGGTVRVSQVQLLQPLSMLVAVPLLGERLDLLTLGLGVAVVATVLIGRRLAAPGPTPSRSPT